MRRVIRSKTAISSTPAISKPRRHEQLPKMILKAFPSVSTASAGGESFIRRLSLARVTI